MPKFELSSFGRLFVSDEELEHLPAIRQIFAIVTALVGIVALTKFLLVLTSKSGSTFRFINLNKTTVGRIVPVYLASHLIHSIHYVDVEPKWLYQKYLISEMEITFFANFPITLAGLYFMERLVKKSENYNDTSNDCKRMICYVLGSLLTLGHYRTEPPWKYEAFVNFTIAGEGVATILLALLLYQLRKESLRKMTHQSLDLEQSGALLDDESEQKEFAMKFASVRSRTPVKL